MPENLSQFKEDFRLNREQQEAVSQDPSRPCLVIAGPGAGKTAVIAARCRYLIESAGIKPSEILVLTFTRAAAFEMQERFRLLTKDAHPGVFFGTFHAVLYRSVSKRYGFSAENLVRENEKQQILQEILRKMYPDALKDSNVTETLLSGFSAIWSGGTPVAAGSGGQQGDSREAQIAALYTAELRKRRKIDYDDILLLAREMLRNDADVRTELREKYRYILVDEYQDVSPVQAEILKLLAAPSNRIFAVGDDDQAIYRFRGASPDIMLHFPKEYPGTRIVRLTRNYRSCPEIVQSSLQLIGHNRDRYQKALRAETKTPGSVSVRRFESERDEYRTIAEELRTDLDQGMELSETAVLFRTNAAISACTAALLSAGVPFLSRDRVQNPFSHYAAEPVFAILNYALGDHSRANFLKFMNCPPRYFRRADLPGTTVELPELLDFYRKDPERSFMAAKTERLMQELALLSQLSIPFAMINYIRKGMGIDEYFQNYAEDRGLYAEEISATLDFVQDSAREFRTVPEWYRYIARFEKELSVKEADTDVRGHVILSTIHRAKGLEFSRVIVTDVCEQNIPHQKAETEAELSEERRLLYVAMTRAKTDLRLYVPARISGRRREESRFLREIRGSSDN